MNHSNNPPRSRKRLLTPLLFGLIVTFVTLKYLKALHETIIIQAYFNNIENSNSQPGTSRESKASFSFTANCPEELALPEIAHVPITHAQYYSGEREIFGYSPTFVPNVVSFNLNNVPFIRDGLKIQIFNIVECSWDVMDLTEAIHSQYPNWNPNDVENNGLRELKSYQSENRIVFDTDGDAYLIIASKHWPGIGTSLLLHSRNYGESWDIYEIPQYRHARLEFQDGHNEISRPPVIQLMDDTLILPLAFIAPTKKSDGTLYIPEPIALDENGSHQGHQSSNFAVSKGDFTYFVWASWELTRNDGTPTYIASYNHVDHMLSQPVFLGYGGEGAPNGHNVPAITIDSEGYLHVILGAHHDWFKYTHSLIPYSIENGWTKLVEIPHNDPECNNHCNYYTYVHLLTDYNDTLHVVARWAGNTPGYTYFFRLAYFRKPKNGDWEARRTLVIPYRNFYSNWYQRVSIDREGRLFISYVYYGNQLFLDQALAYDTKWPEDIIWKGPTEPLDCTPTDNHYCWFYNIWPHDPVLLVSDNNGDSWRIATSCDFGLNDSERIFCNNDDQVFLPLIIRRNNQKLSQIFSSSDR